MFDKCIVDDDYCDGIEYFFIGLIPLIILVSGHSFVTVVHVGTGFPLGKEYTGWLFFVAEYSLDRQCGLLQFGSILGFVLGAGLVVLAVTCFHLIISGKVGMIFLG